MKILSTEYKENEKKKMKIKKSRTKLDPRQIVI